MKDEKIIEKIRKVLELSKNNPSQEEAKSAALKAQKLMAEYHISMSQVDAIEADTIGENAVAVGKGNKWKYFLASIVAENFRCKHFLYGTEHVVFYGYETDTEIAAETFRYLFETGNKAANNYYQKQRNACKREGWYFDGRGLKNSFLYGFLDGIKEVLDKQCTALMIVTPQEVKDSFAEKSKGMRTSHNVIKSRNNNAQAEGRRVGRDAIGSRKLSMA